jgi:hemerythrin superfamily protein
MPPKKSPAKKAAAKKAAAKKTSVKKAAARKTTAARKTAAKKTSTAKKAVGKKTSTVKKSASRKAGTAKKTAKRAVKRAVRKAAPRKATAKKTAKKTVKKTVKSAKSATKTAKRAVKKTVKKVAPRKASAKKATAAKKATKKRAVKKALPAAARKGVTGASADAIEMLVADHREVDQLFTQFEAAAPDSTVAKDLADKIVRELSVHAAIEELVLYPVARRVLEQDDLVDAAIDEHNEMKELLAEVDGKAVGDDRVRRTFHEIKLAVEEHVHEEETELFPRLRGKIDQDDLQRMGRALEGAKAVAPTHPHPHAPDRPPGNIVIGPAAGVIDRIRDIARRAMG